MTPFWYVGPLSVDTRIATAARHGDADRLTDTVLRLWAAADEGRRSEADRLAVEACAAEGNAVYPSDNYGEGCSLAVMFAATRLIPRSDRLGLDRVSVRNGRFWSEVGEPVADDLDATGACRCGCGYVAPRAPAFVDHGAAI